MSGASIAFTDHPPPHIRACQSSHEGRVDDANKIIARCSRTRFHRSVKQLQLCRQTGVLSGRIHTMCVRLRWRMVWRGLQIRLRYWISHVRMTLRDHDCNNIPGQRWIVQSALSSDPDGGAYEILLNHSLSDTLGLLHDPVSTNIAQGNRLSHSDTGDAVCGYRWNDDTRIARVSRRSGHA